MKKVIMIVALSVPMIMMCQKNKTVPEDSIIKKWAQAVVNIEVTPSFYFLTERLESLRNTNSITIEEYNRKSDTLAMLNINYRSSGTAIYLNDKEKYFFITAKHMMIDATSRDRNSEKIMIRSKSRNKGNGMPLAISMATGGPEAIYQLSAISDVGIFSLSDALFGQTLIDYLNHNNYVPITVKDIDTICAINKGDNILAFGFPEPSMLGSKNLPFAVLNWESDVMSIPVVSRGRVSDVLMGKNYFYGDIFVFHGNSGGPVVLNNKLIGIVARYDLDTLNIKTTNDYYFLYHNNFVKSHMIMPVLKTLEGRLSTVHN